MNLLNGLVIGIILLVAYLIGKMFLADYKNEKNFQTLYCVKLFGTFCRLWNCFSVRNFFEIGDWIDKRNL